MKTLDRVLQRWRVRQAAPWIRDGDRLLDIGCHDLTLIRRVEHRIANAMCVDPQPDPAQRSDTRLVAASFPAEARFADGRFDCITMLAVLEHVPDPAVVAIEAARILGPGGRVVLTVPHPLVDHILHSLIRLRLLDGMEAGAHHGFDVGTTRAIFEEAGFVLGVRRRFQLGLNNLFVFEKA